MAPLWGRLADRVGRKIMIERSLASFIVVMSAMAFVTAPWHVFALRAIQGLFAGYGALALTMAADAAPREQMAFAIGTVQTAQRLGPALGPVIGGMVAALVGLRQAFLVTSIFYVVALALVFVMYKEPAHHTQAEDQRPRRVNFRSVLAFENFVLLIVVVFALHVRRSKPRPGAAALHRRARAADRRHPARVRRRVLDRGRRRGSRQPPVAHLPRPDVDARGHRRSSGGRRDGHAPVRVRWRHGGADGRRA